MFDDVRNATNHAMEFRSVSAASVRNVMIEFLGPPPSDLDIVFHGANVILGTTVAEARDALAKREPVRFLLPYITPKTRMQML